MSNVQQGNDCQERLDAAYGITTAVCHACIEAKGKDIAVLDVADVFGLADYFVVVSGSSDRQVQGITEKIQSNLAKEGIEPIAIEGHDRAHWILLDYGDVLVHVFYGPVRDTYDLESLWINARRVDIEKELKVLESQPQAA